MLISFSRLPILRSPSSLRIDTVTGGRGGGGDGSGDGDCSSTVPIITIPRRMKNIPEGRASDLPLSLPTPLPLSVSLPRSTSKPSRLRGISVLQDESHKSNSHTNSRISDYEGSHGSRHVSSKTAEGGRTIAAVAVALEDCSVSSVERGVYFFLCVDYAVQLALVTQSPYFAFSDC